MLFGVGGELWGNGELLTLTPSETFVRITALTPDSPIPFPITGFSGLRQDFCLRPALRDCGGRFSVLTAGKPAGRWGRQDPKKYIG